MVEYKKKYTEYRFGAKKYRIVKCRSCGKIFNAFMNGKTEGILYFCNEIECSKNGYLDSATEKEAYDFILNDLKKDGNLSYQTTKTLEDYFPEFKIAEIV